MRTLLLDKDQCCQFPPWICSKMVASFRISHQIFFIESLGSFVEVVELAFASLCRFASNAFWNSSCCSNSSCSWRNYCSCFSCRNMSSFLTASAFSIACVFRTILSWICHSSKTFSSAAYNFSSIALTHSVICSSVSAVFYEFFFLNTVVQAVTCTDLCYYRIFVSGYRFATVHFNHFVTSFHGKLECSQFTYELLHFWFHISVNLQDIIYKRQYFDRFLLLYER